MSPFPTPEQNIGLRLIFAALGESPINRTFDEYMAIAARAPKLSALHFGINRFLQSMAASSYVPFEICTFQGSNDNRDYDRYWQCKKFPTSLSLETLRLAWVKSGMRELQRQARVARRQAARPSR